MNTEVINYGSHGISGLEAVDKLGEWITKSGLFGCTQHEQGKVLALACLLENKSPIQILKEYHLIEGRLSDRADSLLAKFRIRGGQHKVISRTPEVATVELTLGPAQYTSTVTFAELEKEPFVRTRDGKTFKKNWATPRARTQSLWARAIADGVRTVAPEVVAGLYTPEEIEDEIAAARTPVTIDLPAPKLVIEKSPGVVLPTVPTVLPDSALVEPVAASDEHPVQALVRAIIEPLGQPAIDWLVRENHLKPGEGIESLSAKTATRIVKHKDSFIRAVNLYTVKQ